MRKITAKDLLREVQSIKKQASSGLNKPYPIEYETEADLNVGIESALLDILDGFGYMGATDVIVKGNTAYVKGNFELELDVKKILPWWEEKGSGEITADLEKVLGGGYRGEFLPGSKWWAILAESFSIEKDINVFALNFDEQDIEAGEWVVSGNENNFMAKELTGDYATDLRNMADFIGKNTEFLGWWEANAGKFGEDQRAVRQLGEDIVSKLPKGFQLALEDYYDVWQILAPGNNGTRGVFNLPNPTFPGTYIDHGSGNFGLFDFEDDLTGDYSNDLPIMAKWIAKESKKYVK